MTFPQDVYQYLQEHTLVGIKGGQKREQFLEIWMVVVGKRVFARSWKKSEKSWFTAFLSEGVGQIQYGDEVVDVIGRQVNREDLALNDQINQAYLAKYIQEHNRPYALGMTQEEYRDYTMEFFVKEG